MADAKYVFDFSDIVEARREIRNWKRDNSDAIDVVNSRMRAMGKTSEVAFNQFGRAATRAQQRSKRFASVGLQQVGYQVGDFAVQLQGGTNAAVAFGQQFSQLAGIFGAGGAIAGAAVAIGTAFVAPLLEAKKAAADTEEQFQELASTLKNIKEIRLDGIAREFSEQAEKAKQSFNDILGILERVQMRTLRQQLEAPLNAVLQEIKSFDVRSQVLGAFSEVDFKSALGLESRQEAVFLATQLKRLDGETKEELREQVESISEALMLRGILTPEVEKMLAKLATELSLQQDINSEVEKAGENAKVLAEMTEAAQAAGEALKVTAEGIVSAFKAASGIDFSGPIQKALDKAIAFGKTVLGRFMGGTYTYDPQGVGRGRSAGRGGPTAAEIQRYDPRAQIAYQPGGTAGVPLPNFGGSSGGGGGGGAATVSPAQQAKEYFETLNQEAALKRQLVGLNEDDAYALERSAEIKKRLEGIEEGLSSTYSERIEQLIKTEIETRKLMEAEQQRQQLMDTVEGHIENAFMSFVDGSKSVEDAFRGMLRNIILAIYQQQVAKPAATAVGNIISTIFKADGGAFNRGVEFFANGGVVNSPTMFGHSKGIGVMGEAGPEAIMPLKRGKNGKLGVQMEGSSQPVIVNNNFNISANGDDSVKRIIRGEIPRITEATKAAVVDAKRRGGSYGRSF